MGLSRVLLAPILSALVRVPLVIWGDAMSSRAWCLLTLHHQSWEARAGLPGLGTATLLGSPVWVNAENTPEFSHRGPLLGGLTKITARPELTLQEGPPDRSREGRVSLWAPGGNSGLMALGRTQPCPAALTSEHVRSSLGGCGGWWGGGRHGRLRAL